MSCAGCVAGATVLTGPLHSALPGSAPGRLLYKAPCLIAVAAVALWFFSARGTEWGATSLHSGGWLPAPAKEVVRAWRGSRNAFVLLARHRPFQFFTACLPLVLLIVRLGIAVRAGMKRATLRRLTTNSVQQPTAETTTKKKD